MKNTFLAVSALAVSASLAGAQTTIATSGNGSGVSPFGKPNTQTYGQTFTVPVNGDDALNSFAFWVAPTSNVQFRGYVFAWDAASQRATGSALFTSAVMSVPTTGSGWLPASISTGGLALAGGNMYVAFLSASGLTGTSTTTWELSNDPYTGGGFVYQNNGDDTGAWTTQGWNGFGGQDVRFEMEFSAGQVSAVPEPATVALSATGLLALGGIGAIRRRRQSQQG